MSAIGPGDFVECVDGRCVEGSDAGFSFGQIYVVSEVGDLHGKPWLNCVGMPTPGQTDPAIAWAPGWDARCFRPVYRPKSDTFSHLLQPAQKEGV